MSHLPPPVELDRPLTTLPVAAYSDPALLALERERLFARAPRYVGHALSVPEIGDYFALPAEGEGRILVRTGEGVKLLSNVCRHRQAIMLNGRGNTQNIVCPLHRWTYDLNGTLLGAPQFEATPCTRLNSTPLQEWNGLLFEGGDYAISDVMADLRCSADLDFSGYRLDRVHLHECDYNWKTFIEVYLEDYHVEPFHPGLGKFVACNDLSWQFNERYSVQTVGVNNGLAKPGTPTYKRWHEAVQKHRGGTPPTHGAIWLTLYPNLMIEWYPHVLVVSHLIPRSATHTTNVVEFYYPEEIVHFEREFVEAQQAAYFETCEEDDEISQRMDAGRRALLGRGADEAGPYQSPLEDGMQHFHAWYRRAMA